LLADWAKAHAERVVLLLINVEGDDVQLAATTKYCAMLNLGPREERTYVHGAFVGEEPAAFKQFGMSYIPHVAVLSPTCVLMGNKVKPKEQALVIAAAMAA